MNHSPEYKYPAAKEDIDTIITGSDGKDYIIDIIDGERKWVLYLPEENDVIVIEKSLTPINIVKKEITAPIEKKIMTKYQLFLSEMTTKLKLECPLMTASERKDKISAEWVKHKNKK